MTEKEVIRWLYEALKSTFQECGFKFETRLNRYKRKIDSNRLEAIYIRVRQVDSFRYEATFAFSILFSVVEETWAKIHRKPFKLFPGNSTVHEFSELFKLKKGTWIFDMDDGKSSVLEDMATFITDTICPWFSSIHSLKDARDWLSNKGKVGSWRWPPILVLDYLLNDSGHCSSFLDSAKSVIEQEIPDYWSTFQIAYAPYHEYDASFFKAVEIHQKTHSKNLQSRLDAENALRSLQFEKPSKTADKFLSEMYDVYVFLGSPEHSGIKQPEGWRNILSRLSALAAGSTKVAMELSSRTIQSRKRLIVDLESDESLNEAIEQASSAILESGTVRVSSSRNKEFGKEASPPDLWICCASQTSPQGTSKKFDPFFLFAVPFENSHNKKASLDVLVNTISAELQAKLSVNQQRTIEMVDMIGGRESLLDAPFGIFKPGNRHLNEPTAEILRGRWQVIT